MKKINLMVSTDIDGKGGVATVVQGYRDCGFFATNNVALISSHRDGKKFSKIYAMLYFFSALAKVFYFHVFYKVGFVHIHMSSRGSYFRKSMIIRIVKMMRGKVILHLHGGEFHIFYNSECSHRKKEHIRKTFALCDEIIVLSSQWVDWFQKTFSRYNNIEVIYNVVSDVNLKSEKKAIGNILFLGRMCNAKGVMDLIQSFSKVVETFPNARLKLGGDGDVSEYQAEAERLGILNSVQFLGWVAGARKAQLMAEADIYCLPSYNEGFPMGVLEAMANSVAVVSTRVGGIPDAITSGIDGTLIDAGDVNALANALIELITNRELNDAYVTAAKNKFEQRFSVDAVMPQLNELYKKVLAKSTD
ncbi:glycosyltransferase family 4 protein [Vibrio sp. IRLE0018]|uniref:glycosyltransferase family 4 protein n=1 Tax=Vibrio floridensis TaxID=2908007 RepID=UPI001F3A9A80|nr:glycosyltransferase family 4 protein [Vibrio floridensis]MCF8780051.1 glycosyltransferase family 4 protein [Vibrio floridensis]